MNDSNVVLENRQRCSDLSLADTLSVDSYWGQRQDEFQTNLKRSLSRVLSNAAASTSCNPDDSPVFSYDKEKLVQEFQTVQFTEIFNHHDQIVAKSIGTDEHSTNQQRCVANKTVSTVLTIFIELIANPFVWPSCCQVTVAAALVSALLDHGAILSIRDRMKSNAHKFARKVVLQILQRNMTPWNQPDIVSSLLPEFNTKRQSSMSRIGYQLSLIQEWLSGLGHGEPSSFVRCLCNVLGELDRMEVLALHNKKNDNQGYLNTTKSSQTLSTRRNDFRCSAEIIDHLHGDYDEEESEALISSLGKQRRQQQHSFVSPSAKKLIWSSVGVSHDHDDDERGTRRYLRSKCVELLLGIGQKCRRWSSFIGLLLSEAASCTHSASICWLILLLVDPTDDDSEKMTLIDLTLVIWKRRRDDPFFVELFFSLLSECSLYDNVEHLWKALRPFHVLVHETMKEDATIPMTYRFHFALLLTRRGNLLESHPQFSGLAAQLSMAFGTVNCWIMPEGQQDQLESIVEALQQAKILGASSWQDHDTNRLLVDAAQSTKTRVPIMLRRASTWCANRQHQRPHLLSTMSLSNGSHPVDKTHQTNKSSSRLHSDVLSHVFAFLGYKHISQARRVSKEWKETADGKQLWHSFFKSTFPLLPQDKEAQNESRPWKELFRDKIFARGELRARNCRRPGTLRLCQVVGCCAIVSTKSLDKHHASHWKKKRATRKTSPESSPKKQRARAPKESSTQKNQGVT